MPDIATFDPLGSRRLRVGLVGCGAIARPHLETLMADGGAIEVHLLDARPAAARALAASIGGTDSTPVVHTEPEAFFAVGLDAVHVLTPPGAHVELAHRALAAGAHTLVEKPFSLTLAEADVLIAAADEADRMICVDHSTLWMPCVRTFLDRLHRGELGRPVAFSCFYGHAESRSTIPYSDPYHWSYDLPGGPLVNHVSHPASLLVEVMGSPRAVQAMRSSRNVMPNDEADSLSVTVDTANGYATMLLSMAHGNHHRHATIWCEEGTAFLDLTRQTCVISRHRGPIGVVPKMFGGVSMGAAQVMATAEVGMKVVTRQLAREPGVRALVAQFVAAVRTGARSPVSRVNTLGVAKIQQVALIDTPIVTQS